MYQVDQEFSWNTLNLTVKTPVRHSSRYAHQANRWLYKTILLIIVTLKENVIAQENRGLAK
jgi:hypothetical protein